MRRRPDRGRPPEPRYLWCEECATLLEPVEENSPALSAPIVEGQHLPPVPHAVSVLRRSEVRERAGDLSAVEALTRLIAHRAHSYQSVSSSKLMATDERYAEDGPEGSVRIGVSPNGQASIARYE